MLSWTDKGEYKAELLNYPEYEPVVVIRTDDTAGGELIIKVSHGGKIKLPDQKVSHSHVRISSHYPIALSAKKYTEMQKAISEARELLRGIHRRGRVVHRRKGGKTSCGMKVDGKTWTGAVGHITCKTCLVVG